MFDSTNATITTHEEAAALCEDFNIPSNRANHRRITKARWLAANGYIKLQADFGDEQIYIALSQNTDGEAYTVRRNGKVQCTCPDHQRTGEKCKHSLACLLFEENQREAEMIRAINEYETDRFACDFEGGF